MLLQLNLETTRKKRNYQIKNQRFYNMPIILLSLLSTGVVFSYGACNGRKNMKISIHGTRKHPVLYTLPDLIFNIGEELLI